MGTAIPGQRSPSLAKLWTLWIRLRPLNSSPTISLDYQTSVTVARALLPDSRQVRPTNRDQVIQVSDSGTKRSWPVEELTILLLLLLIRRGSKLMQRAGMATTRKILDLRLLLGTSSSLL